MYSVMTSEYPDAKAFINETKKCPLLWDGSVYHHIEWEVIVKKFNEQFDSRSKAWKQKTCEKYRRRWCNIRHRFNRWSKSTGQGLKISGTRYIHARYLTFLNEANHHSHNQNTYSQKDPIKPPQARLVGTQTIQQSKESSSWKRPGVKPLKDIEKVGAIAEDFDEDEAFFESLLLFTKTFSFEEELEFETGVLNLVERISLRTNRS